MAKRKRERKWPPKGSYPHPAGGYIHASRAEPGHRYRIVAHLKAEPDLDKLALAVIQLAKSMVAQEKREAAATVARDQKHQPRHRRNAA